MTKATWYFSDGSKYTNGATGDVMALIYAGMKVAKRRGATLTGWTFESGKKRPL